MKRNLVLTACLTAAMAAVSLHTRAADLWWDGGTSNIATNGDGASAYVSGTWNTTLQNWDQGTGMAHVAWNNAGLDSAIFGGSYVTGTKTITIGANVTVNQLFINTGSTGANRYDFGTSSTQNDFAITFGGTYSDAAPTIDGTLGALNNNFNAKITGTIAGGLVLKSGNNIATPASSGRFAFLNTNNNFVGDIVLAAGNLAVTGNSTLGHTNNRLVLRGGALFSSSGSSANVTVTRNVVVESSSGIGLNATGSGNVLSIAGPISGNGDLTRYAGGAGTFDLKLQGDMSGYGGVFENRGGSLFIETTAASGGTWKLTTGTAILNATNSDAIANGTGKPNLVMNGGTLNLNGRNETINGLEGTAGFVQNQLTNSTAMLTLGDGNATTSYGGTIRNNAGTGGTLAVVKIGTGTQTLTGTNQAASYTVSAGTLEVSDASGAYAFTGPITNNATLSFDITGTQIHNGAIAGSGSLTKKSGGALSLAGSLTYAGGTTVEGGKLSLPTTKAGTGSISVASSANLEVRRTALNAFINAASSTLNGARLDFHFNNQGLNATAPLQVAGNLANSGYTTIYIAAPGGLALGSYPLIKYGSYTSNALSSFNLGAAINPRVTATIQDNPANKSIDLVITSVDFVKWTGSTDGNWDTSTPNWILTSSGLATTYGLGDFARFDDSAPGTTTISIANDPAPGFVLVTNQGKDYTFGGFAGIGGSGGLVKQGTGKLTLANYINTYSGGTAIQGGTLQLGDGAVDATIPDGIENNATLAFNVASVNAANNITGTGTLSKTGPGALTLGGVNSYAGATTVSAGTVKVTSSSALGSSAGATTVSPGAEVWVDAGGLNLPEPLTVNGSGASGLGALVANTGASTWSGGVELAGDTVLGAASGASLTLSAGIAANNHQLLVNANSSGYLNVAGTVASMSVTLANTGGLLLSAANPALTNVQNLGPVTSGSSPPTTSGIWARHDWALGTNSVVTLTNGNHIGDTGTQLGLDNNVNIPSGVSLVAYCPGDGLEGPGGYRCSFSVRTSTTNVWNGPITLHGADPSLGVTSAFILNGGHNGTSGRLVVNGDITVPDGVLTLLPRGWGSGQFNGRLNLGTNIFSETDGARWTVASTGNTWSEAQIGGSGATLALGANNALCVTAPVRFLANSTLALDGFNQTLPGLYGTTGTVVNHSTNAHSTLTLTGPGDWTFGGALVLSGLAGAKQFGLDMAGGTLTLTNNANSYAGPTVIRSGAKLALAGNGDISSSDIDVQAGGTFDVSARGATLYPPLIPEGWYQVTTTRTLKGNGTVNGSITNSGTLAPGGSVGTLTVTTNVTFAPTGKALMEVDNAAHTSDLLEVGGALTYGGTLTITNVSATAYTNNQVLKLFNAASYSGAFASIVFPGVTGYDASNLTGDGSIKVTSVIPTTPTSITVSVAGGQMTIGWPANYVGWRLESQTNSLSVGLSNNWVTVPGSTTVNSMTFPIGTGDGTVFFRLVYP